MPNTETDKINVQISKIEYSQTVRINIYFVVQTNDSHLYKFYTYVCLLPVCCLLEEIKYQPLKGLCVLQKFYTFELKIRKLRFFFEKLHVFWDPFKLCNVHPSKV